MISALAAVALPGIGKTQSPPARDELVVYCRDPARGIITRLLASECKHERVTKEQAEAARRASIERRRQILEGGAASESRGESAPTRGAAPGTQRSVETPQNPAQEPRAETSKVDPPSRGAVASRGSQRDAGYGVSAISPEDRARIVAEKNLGKVAALVAQMKAGEWRELPDTRMQDVFPGREGHPAWGNQGPVSVTLTWGGAAFDTKRNVLVVTGGGHADYGGNEVYEFSLSTMRWKRATEPSPLRPRPGMKGAFDVADGSEAPVSTHTYDGLVYLPNVDKVFKFGGSPYQLGYAGDRHAYLYDVESHRWKRGAEAPKVSLEVSSAYDPATGEAIVGFREGIMAYDPKADRWRVISADDDANFGRVADLDPVARRFVQLGSAAGPVVYYDLARTGRRTIAAVSGDTGFTSMRAAGLAYHVPTGRFAVWQGGREVWAIDPRNWQVEMFANRGQPAPDHEGTLYGRKTAGIYGRWQYVPDLDVFIAYGHSTDNVWLYKLPPRDFAEAPVATKECRDADLCVGPGYEYLVPSEAARVAKPGQVVAISAGDYVDCAVWPVGVRIRGVGGRPHIRDKTCKNKAIWIVQGDETVIENVELSGAVSSDGNGNAIRFEGKSLTLRDCSIHHNQIGVLTNHNPDATVEIRNCEFYGQSSRSDLPHNIYIGKIASFTAVGNFIREALQGHHIKTTARKNRLIANLLVDERGTEAAMIDAWGCSDTLIAGNIMSKTGKGGNLNFITLSKRVEYGKEVPCRDVAGSSAQIAYNTAVFANPDRLYSAFVSNGLGISYTASNNIIVNTREIEFYAGITGRGRLLENIYFRDPMPELFVDAAGFDFHVRKQIPAGAEGYRPDRQYRHPASTMPRIGGKTAGALEFSP